MVTRVFARIHCLRLTWKKLWHRLVGLTSHPLSEVGELHVEPSG